MDTPTDKPWIVFDNVSFRYERNAPLVIQDVTLQIYEGDFLAFIGQNGAGKTTLAKHINGILKPTSGRVLVGGRDSQSYKRLEMARLIGYCYQNPDHQIFSQTVEAEVEYGPKALGYSPEKIKEQAEWALDLVQLSHRRKIHPSMLGRGERQRLAVASILAMGVSTLVVDEPTTGLDYTGVIRVMDLLASWNRQFHTTIIIITHDIPIVADYVPRTVLMAEGHVLLDGATATVLQSFERLEKAAVRPPQVTRVARALGLLDEQTSIVRVPDLARALLSAMEKMH
jgi:energy-coupling factor transport system ATP-binding protein